MNWYERGVLVVPAPEEALIVDALKTVPFRVYLSEINFSPRQDLPEGHKVYPVRMNRLVRNLGSYVDQNIFYDKPQFDLLGEDKLHWPSLICDGSYQAMRYRFEDAGVGQNYLIQNFANRHLDPAGDEYLLAPGSYQFDSCYLASTSHPDDDDPDIRLSLTKKDNDVAKLRLQVAQVNIRRGIEYALWFGELAQKHGQKAFVEVDEAVVVAS